LDSPVIENCVFVSNLLDTDVVNCDDFGGGALHIADTSDFTIDSCYFYKNQANYDCKGGGIYSLRSNFDLKNTSFQANAVESTPGNTTKGAGVAWEGGGLVLSNCTLASHVSGETLWGNSNDIYALKISNSTFYGNGHDGIYKTILNDGDTHLKNSILLVKQGEFEDITDGFGELIAYQGDFNLVLERKSNQNLVFDLITFGADDYDTILIGSDLSEGIENFTDGKTRLPVLPLIKNSPALDMASSTDIDGNVVSQDQRGFVRPQGDGYDIGAYELLVDTFIVSTYIGNGGSITPESATVNEGNSATFIITADENYHIEEIKQDDDVIFTRYSYDEYTKVYEHTVSGVTSNITLSASFAADEEPVDPVDPPVDPDEPEDKPIPEGGTCSIGTFTPLAGLLVLPLLLMFKK
jgi:hypothetical protein